MEVGCSVTGARDLMNAMDNNPNFLSAIQPEEKMEDPAKSGEKPKPNNKNKPKGKAKAKPTKARGPVR